MFEKPYIEPAFQDYIRKKLADIEQQHHIKILLAVESGSRAWGFPSKDSDYDVRFIYTHHEDAYLTVRELRNVIETPILQDNILGTPLDLNGWDIRKTLQLALKSNPVLVEWLTSPIMYISVPRIVNNLLIFSRQAANIQAFQYHYDRLARNSWEQILDNAEQVKLKLYCYALRPILAIQWMLSHNEAPPMDIRSLCKGLSGDKVLINEIARLIDLKAGADEGYYVPRNPILDAHIESVLQNKTERPIKLETDIPSLIDEANRLFRAAIKHG
ncbi:MAG TPA: nucleotidyltransferase domain-containing protein [Alphaproteobacteria bacterium]|nr:nucleotidyltransferase domain-containing protein [Alphaproteobacteria bacterium]